MEKEARTPPAIRAVILVGGPSKGTRFRPLTLNSFPKPLFPIAGKPMITHHIEACANVPGMKEILLMGFYEESQFTGFMAAMSEQLHIPIKYLQESSELGTAGGLHHFRDQITKDSVEAFFVLHCDICCPFPLKEMLEFHRKEVERLSLENNELLGTLLGSTVKEEYANCYGCLVEGEDHRLLHYVEKPTTFVSNLINSGIYCFSPKILDLIGEVSKQIKKEHGTPLRASINELMRIGEDQLRLEQDIFMPLAEKRQLSVFRNKGFWRQIKNAGAPVYCNELYLAMYAELKSPLLSPPSAGIIGNVIIHPTAKIHPTALLGPNVTIGPNVVIKRGVRVLHSIILENSTVKAHSLIMYSIIAWGCTIERWCRIEGLPNPTPNLYLKDGTRKGICVVGQGSKTLPEVIIRNCIILSDKILTSSFFNEILL